MIGQRPALSGPLHVLWHVLLVLFGWALFCGFWWVTLFRQPLFPVELTLLVAGSLLLAPLVTLYWVMHNRGIHARKGPRRQARSVSESYSHDWAGRVVRAHFDALRRCSVVIVSGSAEEKYFLNAGDALSTMPVSLVAPPTEPPAADGRAAHAAARRAGAGR